jgi:ectoine hydroxylase-related dioxygenase (phytanoyl-CoA dioxygenase family)
VSFEHDGYEVFRGVVDQNSMAEVALAVHKACVLFRESEAQRSAGISLSEYMEQHPDRNPGVTREGLADEPYILGNLAALDVRFRRLIVQESLWQLAASLLSVQFADVVYHYAQVVRKPGRIGPALSWHRDYGNTYISTDGPYFVRLLIPVQGMGQENGGTGVVSRSNPSLKVCSEKAIKRVDSAPSTLRSVLATSSRYIRRQYMVVERIAAPPTVICSPFSSVCSGLGSSIRRTVKA